MVATTSARTRSHYEPDFQSPFHRGNGCYCKGVRRWLNGRNHPFSPLFIGAMAATVRWSNWWGICFLRFQSPFHRGNGCYITRRRMNDHVDEARLSVPFSSGQWLLQDGHAAYDCSGIPFSPLFIGAMAATLRLYRTIQNSSKLSVPFSSGQWLLQQMAAAGTLGTLTFSPLFIGAMAATAISVSILMLKFFQSPFHRGNGCYQKHRKKHGDSLCSFSPLFIGAMAATGATNDEALLIIKLSVPFSSGQWLLRMLIERRITIHGPLSVPFSSGQWLLLLLPKKLRYSMRCFQSPFHRGNGCYR